MNNRKLAESIFMALRSIGANKIRSLLTALGVMIGVGAVIALVALGNGAQRSVEESLQSLGTNLMLLYSGEPRGSSLVRRNTSNINPAITEEDISDIQSLVPSYVTRIAVESTENAQVKVGNANLNVTLVGTQSSYPYIRNFYPVHGSFLQDMDELTRETAAVLGMQVYLQLFPGGDDPLGQKIRINGIGFTVVGIMQGKGDSTLDNSVFIPISTFQRYISGEDSYALANIQAVDLNQMDALQSLIEMMLLENRGLTDLESADFYMANQLDLLSTVQGVAETFTILLGSIAAISLLVGGIGIMNIMLVSVTERTREIGIRMALGARSSDILSQFMIEAIIISLLGGLIGILGGIAASWAATRFGGLAAYVSPGSIVLAFSTALITGLFFGGYPAWRASRLDPIEALRFE